MPSEWEFWSCSNPKFWNLPIHGQNLCPMWTNPSKMYDGRGAQVRETMKYEQNSLMISLLFPPRWYDDINFCLQKKKKIYFDTLLKFKTILATKQSKYSKDQFIK